MADREWQDEGRVREVREMVGARTRGLQISKVGRDATGDF